MKYKYLKFDAKNNSNSDLFFYYFYNNLYKEIKLNFVR